MTRGTRGGIGVACAAGAALLLAGCSSAMSGPRHPGASYDVQLSGSLTVFAAASLTTSFTELADRFESEHPGTSVQLSFAGSSALVTQIIEGAPADVFASADERTMESLIEEDLAVGTPVVFATNELTIAVQPGNPASIGSLADLDDAELDIVVCAPAVPCGAATERVENVSGVELRPVSEESSVTDVLGKVTSGQADAGVVYVTDVRGADGAADAVSFAESADAITSYPIAAVAGSQNVVLARDFVTFVASDAGQSVLRDAGFGAAP
ncbi:molybdate ABC transporter substrate-binding protein [Marisediminicola sp. LYQ134]|uniref:molybdate ABC transporter substrate-binding protein n=1 Tax=Marisediminicola sp. LYQ134 TaxID=3391061 RepID=UPI0039838D78